MVTAPAKMRQHVLALDGIRGLAILLVLAYHLLHANSEVKSALMVTLEKIPGGMWAGVDLFFVLSGFLITGILYDSLDDEGFFKKFYGRRTLRIFPLYYGLLLVLVALTVPLHLEWERMLPAMFLYLQNTRIFQPVFHYNPSAEVHLSHLWSLAVEEQFYLVWPVLVFWIRDLRRLLFTALAGAALSLLLRSLLTWDGTELNFLYVFTPCRADSLLLGGALALALRSHWRERVLASATLLMAVGAAGVAAIIVHDRQFHFSQGFLVPSIGFTLLATFSVGLIAHVYRPSSRLRPLFEMPWLRLLGKYSYGLYVFHFPLDSWLTVPIRAALLSVSHSRLVSVLGAGLVVTLLALLVAYVSFHLYERQFLRLKKYFEYNQRTRAVEASHGEASLPLRQ